MPEAGKADAGLGLRQLQLTTSDHFAARTARERRMIRARLIAPRRASDSVEKVQTCDSQAEQRLDSAALTASPLRLPESWIFAAAGNVMMLNAI